MYTVGYMKRGFWVTHTGVIDIHEINKANENIINHYDFDTHNYQLINLTGADFSLVNKESAAYTGAMDASASMTRSNVKVALVGCNKKAVDFCLEYISISKQLESNWRFELFENAWPAVQWAVSPRVG